MIHNFSRLQLFHLKLNISRYFLFLCGGEKEKKKKIISNRDRESYLSCLQMSGRIFLKEVIIIIIV